MTNNTTIQLTAATRRQMESLNDLFELAFFTKYKIPDETVSMLTKKVAERDAALPLPPNTSHIKGKKAKESSLNEGENACKEGMLIGRGSGGRLANGDAGSRNAQGRLDEDLKPSLTTEDLNSSPSDDLKSTSKPFLMPNSLSKGRNTKHHRYTALDKERHAALCDILAIRYEMVTLPHEPTTRSKARKDILREYKKWESRM